MAETKKGVGIIWCGCVESGTCDLRPHKRSFHLKRIGLQVAHQDRRQATFLKTDDGAHPAVVKKQARVRLEREYVLFGHDKLNRALPCLDNIARPLWWRSG